MKVTQPVRTEAGNKLQRFHLFFLKVLANCLPSDMRKPHTETRKQPIRHQDLLEGFVKIQMPGPPQTFLIRWVRSGAQSFAFLTSSQVVLLLLLQGPALRAAGIEHRAP